MKSNILKSIFLTILLLLGVSHAANAAITGNIYFDNTSTKWGTVYCFLGHNGYLQSYAMTLDHDGIWKTTESFNNAWNDATGIYFASSDGGVSNGITQKKENINTNPSDLGLTLYTNKSNTISAGTSNCYVPQSSSNNASLSIMSVEAAIAAHGGTGEVTNTDLIAVLNGTKVMFYYGDTWGSGRKYLRISDNTGNAVDEGQSSNTTFTNSSNQNKKGTLYYRTVCIASAKYYISNSDNWPGVQMSNAAQGGYAYALTSTNVFDNQNGEHIVELPSMSGVTFASNSYSVNEGTINSGISATLESPNSVAGKTNTIKYYYTKDNSTYYTFNPSDVSSLAAGEYTIIAVAYDGSIYVKGGSATLTVSPPCTTPTIAWTTAPADGKVGGNMTATVSTNQPAPTINWASSNTSVATVENGTISYKAAGTTNITASYTGDGNTYCAVEASVSKEITVKEAVKWKIKGSWDNNWEAQDFTDNGDNTCSWSTELAENQKYQFVIFQDETYYKGGIIDSKSNQNILLKTEGNDNSITTSSTRGTYTFIWNYNTKTLSVTYPAITTYTVTISANAGGIVSPSGEQQVGITPIDITATPKEGYEFVDWTCTGGAQVASTTAATTVTATAAGTVTANFTSVSYYYHDEKNTKWQGDGTVGTANPTEGYVYWKFSENQYDDNNFKIFNCKPKPANEQEGQIHPNLIGYDEKIDNTLSNGGLTLTDPQGDNWHNIRLPNTSEAYYIILYLPYSTYNSTNAYKVAIRVTLPEVVQSETYYYFDEKETGWNGSVGKALTDAGDYAFIQRPAYNNTDNKFKIFRCNPKQDNNECLIANGENIAKGSPLEGTITLNAENSGHNNILMPSTDKDYYVILYYPNTTTNQSKDFKVAASYTLPDAEKYNVSFGVVGNTGGTITAKSGSSTITSGQLVSHATFTATPADGYVIEGWYKDAEGNNKIDAAGTNTTYSQVINETNNTVYVKFEKKYAIYFKPNAPINWGEAWAYMFTKAVWNTTGEGKGVNVSNSARSEYGNMSKLNDSVYYYYLQSPQNENMYFALSNADQHTHGELNGCEAVYRGDFHKDMPVFIAQKDQTKESKINNTQYYNEGVWMNFNDTCPGYNLGLRNQTDNKEHLDESYRFTAAEAGDYISTVDVALVAGKTYSFLVKNDKGYDFTPKSATTCTSSNFHFELFKSGNKIEVVITPTITGTYTFQLNLANGKVEIDVLYPTTKYRLVYVEKNGKNIVKFHPSHEIKKRAGGTAEAPLYDTISMHVRPKMLENKKDTADNSNTWEVWLQVFKQKQNGNSMDWETIQNINTQKCPSIKTNGVYNFILRQSGGEATIEPTAIHPYTGRYYIRTDASDGGWNNYKQLSNYFYYTEYSRVYRGFDHYYCRWAEQTNLKYTIACDYSYCVSDTLAQEKDEHSDYTDGNGTLKHYANVRFMWNSFDNTLDRAYIAGAEENLHLLSKGGIFNSEGTEEKKDLVLSDQQNWVYRADVKAAPNTRIKLRATPYNGAGSYAWFRGKAGTGNIETDFNKDDSEILIAGNGEAKYPIRIIYDFKTDHLICAWVPEDTTITDETVINTDLMIIRKENLPAAQLKFDPKNSPLKSVTTAFCVVTLTKELLGDDKLSPQERGIFYVSFPFDVRLADVFGCGKYGVDYVLGYYDGATRAQKGWWSDSGTFWCYVWNPTNFVLKKGVGYILALDYDKIVREQFQHKNTEVNIYFPSYNTAPMDITGELTEVVVPEHKCTIQREDRHIYDSNWNLIGVPSWANVDEFGIPQPVQNNQTSFLYNYDARTDTWTASDAKETTFQSMYAYMVQWAGTINWQERTTERAQQSLQARRNAPAAEGDEEATAIEQYTFRLTLNRGEQQLDHTYIRLQEGNVTTDFDLNYDMTKILNSGANLYSLVGTQQIQCAANVQPLQEEAQTISIPLGVVADQDGLYTFSMPDGTEGMNVSIADSESGTVQNLSLGDYQTALSAGTYEGRFALEIQPRQEVSTGCEQTDAAGKRLRKVLINGNLYILRDGKAYTATGNEL